MENLKTHNTKQIILTADMHGRWDVIFDKIKYFDIKDSLFVIAGDIGVGFLEDKKQNRQLSLANDFFKKRNIVCLCIRGNHDNKRWFDGSVDYSNFKLLPDYSIIEVNGESWQFVGGAISVDRFYRLEGVSYWNDEVFVLDRDKAVKCDVLITHSAPPWIGPTHKSAFVTSFYQKDPTLEDELILERKLHQELMDICQPKKHFCGHFHCSELSSRYIQNGYEVESRILDINEFFPYRNAK
jgi:Icc-related predicted phosphoesterase